MVGTIQYKESEHTFACFFAKKDNVSMQQTPQQIQADQINQASYVQPNERPNLLAKTRQSRIRKLVDQINEGNFSWTASHLSQISESASYDSGLYEDQMFLSQADQDMLADLGVDLASESQYYGFYEYEMGVWDPSHPDFENILNEARQYFDIFDYD